MALGVFICNKKWALYRINTHFLSLWVLILGIQDTPRFSEPRVGLLQGKVLRFFDPNVRSLAHFLADSVLHGSRQGRHRPLGEFFKNRSLIVL